MKNTRVSDVTNNIITIYAGRARICCNTINESHRMNIYSAHIDIEVSFEGDAIFLCDNQMINEVNIKELS